MTTTRRGDTPLHVFRPLYPGAVTRSAFVGKERSTVDKSSLRLEALGLLVSEWQAGRRCYRLTEFGRESLLHARLGRKVFGRQDARPEVKLRRVRAREARTRELAALMDAYERGEGESWRTSSRRGGW